MQKHRWPESWLEPIEKQEAKDRTDNE